MKIELRKELIKGYKIFFSVYVDDKYIDGSINLENAENIYKAIVDNKVNPKEPLILKSEEI